jgi:acetylornithine deacetylase/succinyl-diaminopimelate desuccinylase-like protein
VLNHDGSSVKSQNGVAQVFQLGATEKVYADYQLEVTNRGGHSSQPRPDNAIYELAGGLLKIAKYQFPFELNNVTRAYFTRLVSLSHGADIADYRGILQTPPNPAAIQHLMSIPAEGSILHTTCVATRLEGGHANNALPQRATANVNCRILPGHSKEEVRHDLIRVLADANITVRYVADNGTITDTAPDQRGYPLDAAVAASWPNIPVIPYMDAGASDAIYTSAAGMPTYGVSGVAVDRDDERAHGRDERIRISAFYTGNEFFYRYLKSITAPGS